MGLKDVPLSKWTSQLKTEVALTNQFPNQLVAGPSSTLSPSAKLANAQSIYNANLGLAQGGNIDAVTKFPKAADDLLKAAQAMFGDSLARSCPVTGCGFERGTPFAGQYPCQQGWAGDPIAHRAALRGCRLSEIP